MECDCITKFENRIKEMFKKERGVEPTEVCCKGVGFTLGGGNLNSILNIPFTVKADVTGYRSKGGKDMPVVANYCPFCGKPAREKAKE